MPNAAWARRPTRRLDSDRPSGFGGRTKLMLQFRQSCQNFFAVLLGFYARPDLDDLAMWINQESVPQRYSRRIAQRSVCLRHLLVRIGKQLEGKALLGTEFLVAV